MADPMRQLFGRTPFSGTGRTEDYFGPPPDLTYLTGGRPDFIPEDGGYDDTLDIPGMINQGIPYPVAVQAQQLRQRLHEQGAMQRAQADAAGALEELNTIDPSRETFAKDLLGIFRKYPNARRSKDFLDQVQMIGEFSKMMPAQKQEKLFDLSSIKDPEIRAIAIAEKWDSLPENQGQIRAYDNTTKKSQKLELVKAGYTPEQVAEMEKNGGLTDIGILHAMNQIKATQKEKPERNLTPEAAGDIAKMVREATALRQGMLTDAGKLAWIQQNLANGDTTQTDFPKSAWEQAYQAAVAPNEHELELQAYLNALGITPSEAGTLAPKGAQTPAQEQQAPVEVIDGAVEVTSQEEYDALPAGQLFRDSTGKIKKKGG